MYFCKMNQDKRNRTLYDQAKELRMCNAVHKQWYGRNLSADELFSLYYANLDFCLDYRWPDSKTARRMFSLEELRSHGVVADDTWSLLNPTHSVVMGESKAKIRYNGFTVGRATIIGRSKCDITVKGHAFVTLCVYDEAEVTIATEDSARVIILKYSDKCDISSLGQATIKECF